jgi:hypothetical protein
MKQRVTLFLPQHMKSLSGLLNKGFGNRSAAAWAAKQKLYRGWFNEMIEAAFAAQKAAARREGEA